MSGLSRRFLSPACPPAAPRARLLGRPARASRRRAVYEGSARPPQGPAGLLSRRRRTSGRLASSPGVASLGRRPPPQPKPPPAGRGRVAWSAFRARSAAPADCHGRSHGGRIVSGRSGAHRPRVESGGRLVTSGGGRHCAQQRPPLRPVVPPRRCAIGADGRREPPTVYRRAAPWGPAVLGGRSGGERHALGAPQPPVSRPRPHPSRSCPHPSRSCVRPSRS